MMPFPEAKAAGRNRLDAASAGKASMKDANYRDAEDPKICCATCRHFQPPETCDVVAGKIDPAGVSDLYESANPPAANQPETMMP